MKTAIIGVGNIGRLHLRLIEELGHELVAICDSDEEKLKLFSDKKTYVDYVKMLNEVEIDVVHICTPHYLHADMIIKALDNQINVLCEKPLCIKEEDIERILLAESRSKAVLGVCHQNRYNEENVFLKQYLRGKKVITGYGTMIWNRDAEYYRNGSWRGTWEKEGGGVLINQALHTLDLLQWFIGYPNTVKASLSNNTLKNIIDVEDTATIYCSNGADFTFFATNGAKFTFPVTVVIQLEDELITVFDGKVLTKNKCYDFKTDGKKYLKCCYGLGHKALIQEFYRCVKTGEKFDIDGKEASKVIKIILNAYKEQKNNIK